MNSLLKERRRYPRIEKELPLKIRTDEYDLVTQTKNLSCIGAYCAVDKYIPPLTKLSIILLLPLKTKNKNTNVKIQCKGVVVRTEGKPPEGFNIAIFFNEISPRDKDKIATYVSEHIS